MRVQLVAPWVLALVVLASGGAASAADGVVAVQTADPSCPDDSGDRYVDCNNGTVTDNQTGLVWLKNANCLGGFVLWHAAMEVVAGLSDVSASSFVSAEGCGLNDGSSPGEWRIPSITEWEAMTADARALGCVFGQFGGPSITNDAGTSCWQEGPGNSFSGVQSAYYWSHTITSDPDWAYVGDLADGDIFFVFKNSGHFVWPVRGGQ